MSVNFSNIDTVFLDVDGVLTDGRLTVEGSGDVVVTFSAQDGCQIKCWQHGGGTIAILTGRKSACVENRARMLGITVMRQGTMDKLPAFLEMVQEIGTLPERVCYVGDDLPDIGPMSACGFAVATANANKAVKQVADYTTIRHGGHGAVAEAIEFIFRSELLSKEFLNSSMDIPEYSDPPFRAS